MGSVFFASITFGAILLAALLSFVWRDVFDEHVDRREDGGVGIPEVPFTEGRTRVVDNINLVRSIIHR